MSELGTYLLGMLLRGCLLALLLITVERLFPVRPGRKPAFRTALSLLSPLESACPAPAAGDSAPDDANSPGGASGGTGFPDGECILRSRPDLPASCDGSNCPVSDCGRDCFCC